jgi:hypothetical protein
MWFIKALRTRFRKPPAISVRNVASFVHLDSQTCILTANGRRLCGCAWVADFAGLCRNLQREVVEVLWNQSLLRDSGSAYRGSNPWGAAKSFQFPFSGGKQCGKRRLAQSQSEASHCLLCSARRTKRWHRMPRHLVRTRPRSSSISWTELPRSRRAAPANPR